MTEMPSLNQYKMMKDYCTRIEALRRMLDGYVVDIRSSIESNRNCDILFMAYSCLAHLLLGDLQQTMFYWKKFKDDCNTQMDELLFAEEDGGDTGWMVVANGEKIRAIKGHSEICRRFGEFMKRETSNIHTFIREFLMFDLYMTNKHWVKHIPTKGETFSFKYGGELD